MNVRDLIIILEKCDPEALVVAHLAFQNVTEITSIQRQDLGGIGRRMSFEVIPTVQLLNGDPEHMRSQGLDVLPLER